LNLRTKLVEAYLVLNRAGDAEKVLTAALKKNGLDQDALIRRSRIYLDWGKYTDAENDLNQVLHFRKDSAEAYYLLAKVSQGRANTTKQKQQLQEAQRELTNRKQIEVLLNESQHKAQILEGRLADFQVQLAMQQQLEARLKDKQRQLDVQQGEVSKLEAELQETKKMLEVARVETEKRRQHWHIIRNRGGPESVTAKENKEIDISAKIVFVAILLIVLVAGVAIMFLLRTRS